MRLAGRGLCIAIATLSIAGCDLLNLVMPRKGANPDAPYAGDRPDAPRREKRGNAEFSSAAFDDSGRLLVTRSPMGSARIQVWDARTGALVAGIDAVLPQSAARGPWMIDSKRERLLAAGRSERDHALYDLRTGREIAALPSVERGTKPRIAAGLTRDGNRALFFAPGALELWRLDPPVLLQREDSPFSPERSAPGCVGGVSAFTDTGCWEWSHDRRTLAVAYAPPIPSATSHIYLIDAETLDLEEVEIPARHATRSVAALAFSPDDRWLAIGTDRELLLYDRTSGAWGPAIAGDHPRNRFLGPMRFTADSRRVIALGDVLQLSVFDVATGARLGRFEPVAGDINGVFRVSRDGSRMVIYRFLSDTFEVFDGANAKRLGWVCPYFCNVKHNPFEAPYAVSPDGRLVAISHPRGGTAVWDVASDKIAFPLHDPQRKPFPWPYKG